ncbi:MULTISPECIES: phosphoribosylglycinamide formyltransferase [Thermoactinomyces]|jgi:phosphoribosylglycinamide formyltransferase 1|uniref:Phosphoribosylglycinamide formyltransferase n=1 Tax=Thermoactinomyces daqus TaxID=1329516 RepID=A0A7W1XB76_9BACL|nr:MULTISPECIES: phosphoribosylglycinamide formyltransferase [Thermoactinomyces]MBA4543353.1 phosphoribosylglycinamide formyltransferase [Thermoactinomyces daqus]MBH8608136.1 phosphoribosylglycinamide formyltransferase [Thermoactinomyces sp. CICC 10521]
MAIAVFASGNGSNFQALVESSRRENWPLPISLLICDRPGAKVLDRARACEVEAICVNPKAFPDKKAYEESVLAHLRQRKIEWIVLAGYMRLIGPTLLQAFPKRIVNIHPSLLPAFPGLNAIEKAFSYPVKVSGVTVHYVDEGIDTGPILAQQPVAIEEGDTLESFERKIHLAEHQLYPRVIQALIDGGKKS